MKEVKQNVCKAEFPVRFPNAYIDPSIRYILWYGRFCLAFHNRDDKS